MEVEKTLAQKNIAFHMLLGQAPKVLSAFLNKIKAGALVTDFSPLNIKLKWEQAIAKKLVIPFFRVDAHNIVPCWVASPKQEFGAYTLRPKLHKLLQEFLEEFPKLKKQAVKFRLHPNKWSSFFKTIQQGTIGPVEWLMPGEEAAQKTLKTFLASGLPKYNISRNDPNLNGQSNLSPYLHFGQLSAQRVALEVHKLRQNKNTESFLEELVVRRELSDNFCFYNKNYSTIKGFPAWAQKTLAEHAKDVRPITYSLKQLENAKTHDDLWNACQLEMIKTGKMHGYMRMYWAKKIYEWSKNAATAIKAAVYLNDKYELDGRDPNGYTGIAWSIGGVHDRAWFERPIFGKIRYMSYNGAKGKFNVKKYVEKWTN